LTLLPSGNENLLARYFGLSRSPEDLCRTIVRGKTIQVDAGKAGNRIFLLMIGCGFDAEVVNRVHQNRASHIRKLNYFKPILDAIRSYQYPLIRAYCDEQSASTGEPPPSPVDVRWLFVFNLPCYGGGLRLAPWADGCDGQLDICGFRRGSLGHGLRYAAAVALGRHQRMADCVVRRVKRLRITSDSPVHYQLDGDPAGTLPLDVEALPGRLTLLVPETKNEG
jgi:diacylglycerol kinase (ATP)